MILRTFWRIFPHFVGFFAHLVGQGLAPAEYCLVLYGQVSKLHVCGGSKPPPYGDYATTLVGAIHESPEINTVKNGGSKPPCRA